MTNPRNVSRPDWQINSEILLTRIAAHLGIEVAVMDVRRALLDARGRSSGLDDSSPYTMVADAANRLGINIKINAATGRQAAGLATQDMVIACHAGTSGEEDYWGLLVSSRGRRVRVAVGREEDDVWLRNRDFCAEVADATVQERLIWLVAEHARPCDSASGKSKEKATKFAKNPLLRYLALLSPERSDVLMITIFAVVIGLLALASPIAVELLVNTVAFGQFFQPVIVLAVILGVFLGFRAVLMVMQYYIAEIIQRRLFVRVVADLSDRLPSVNISAFDRQDGGELTNRFFDIVTVQKGTTYLILDGLALVLTTFVGMAVIAFYHPYLLGFDIFLLLAMTLGLFMFGRGGVKSSVKESKTKYYTAGWLEELARNPLVFKADGGVRHAAEHSDRLAREYVMDRKKHFRVLIRQIVYALTLQVVASTVLLGLGGWLVINKQLSLGQLVAAELIVTIIVGAFAKLGKHLENFYDLMAAVDKLGNLFDLPTERRDGEAVDDSLGGTKLEVLDLSYTYEKASSPTIRDVNFVVEPGERVAITGTTGCGKSTLMDLIYGLRDPNVGHIEVNGSDLRSLKLSSFRRSAALVREVDIFAGSIAENVHLDREGISIGDVKRALEKVGIARDVLKLPDGLNTKLLPGGSPLSRVQSLSLMVARAIVRDPSLILVDGLFDAFPDDVLDQILDALFISNPNTTIIVASGRQRVIHRCNRVIDLSKANPELDDAQEFLLTE